MNNKWLRLNYLAIITLMIIIIGYGAHTNTPPTTTQPQIQYTSDNEITEPDPLPLQTSLGYHEYLGEPTPILFPVKNNESTIELRGYTNITGLQVMRRTPADPETLIFVDQNHNPIKYPIPLTTDPETLQLRQVQDAQTIHIKGTIYNYTGWDTNQYTVLMIDYIDSYTVEREPRQLTIDQVEINMDAKYYHTYHTAWIIIQNLSEDWLETDREITLYKDINETWIKTQSYPEDYITPAEQVGIYPGQNWEHPIPLTHLEPGLYKLEKKVWHPDQHPVTVNTFFTIVEETENLSNATHVYGLESINCTLPTVPAQIPIAKKHTIPIKAIDAREIAENVFGFQEPYSVENHINPYLRQDDQRLEFITKYDLLYHTDPGAFNKWNRTQVIETAETFLAKLEPYWVDETPVNYTLVSVAPSHISSSSPITYTIREVGVRYQNTLDGIPLHGPGADFTVSICQYMVSSCEIRRPILTIEGYTDITVTPREAIQMMLRGESATPELGFGILQFLPHGSPLTINEITLTYYTDFSGEWLVPVYYIKGIAHIDPTINDEPTTDFTWFIFATDFRP
ncbi:MAG: hypothetical protein NWF07_14270 [Candidatus Bathyarchaeota archaeon]|nr:hypothetical protein [Candidatus Bathyarchaeota archaeon]